MQVGFAYHDNFLRHRTGPSHPERPARLQAIVDAVRSAGLDPHLARLSFQAAAPESVALIHEPAYVDLVRLACQEGLTFLGSQDTDICPDSYDVALLAVGAVVEACERVMAGDLQRAFCAVRPPGHHAERALAAGYCLFNNVAIAAEHLIRKHALKRVAIVDFDVHHGNGTQHAFQERSDVLFVSLHQHPATLYPGSGFAHETGQGVGEGFTLNVPMRPGSGDEEYRRAFDEQVLPRLEGYAPEFLLVSAGFDAVAEDPLAQINLRPESYRWMTEALVGVADGRCGGRLVSVMEGGYDLTALGRSVVAHIEAMI